LPTGSPARSVPPTDVQAQAWPVIAQGEHVLVTAPTGSGKTLTAFLWSINQLITGPGKAEGTRILYISPLKALNNDIRRNFLQPLDSLKHVFDSAGEAFPDIQVRTRSGDTPQDERRRMLRRPPDILITTPESLHILLTSANAHHLFTRLQTVILDEIHAVIGSKRGTLLMSAIERLVPIEGEFQSCPFCIIGQVDTSKKVRECEAAKNYGNVWLFRSVCSCARAADAEHDRP
jgi:ATP-dependent Lhr-like helicase